LKKKLSFIVMILCLVVISTGCGQNAAAGEEVSDPPVAVVETTNDPADDFIATVLPIYADLPGHLGEQVAVDGFVRVGESYGPNEFMVARLYVDCCFDDASPMGFVVSWDGGEIPAADEWVRVTGIVTQRESTDPDTGAIYIQPAMTAESVEMIEAYESVHVFAE
jgi:uncharacterized repeat protein (TIGR03943 family)